MFVGFVDLVVEKREIEGTLMILKIIFKHNLQVCYKITNINAEEHFSKLNNKMC